MDETFFTAVEVERMREETPGCQPKALEAVKGVRDDVQTDRIVHLNHAGASLPPACVVDTAVDYLTQEALEGGYELNARLMPEINGAYQAIADFINAGDATDIAFVESATVGYQSAFCSIEGWKDTDYILCSMVEYHAGFIPFLQVQKRHGVTIETIPDDPATGAIDLSRLRERLGELGESARLISLVHIPTNGGVIQPAVEVGKLVAERNEALRSEGKREVLFFLDACQSVGQIPIDVQEIQCDALSTSARKYLRGPRGIGFLYARKSAFERGLLGEPVALDGWGGEWTGKGTYQCQPNCRRYETWETNHALTLGMGAAASYAAKIGMDKISGQLKMVAKELRAKLAELEPLVKVADKGVPDSNQGGIVTFALLNGASAADLKERLGKRGIRVSVTVNTSTQLDMEDRGHSELVRSSVHYITTRAELEYFIAELRAALT